jgi:two-component system, OmpR family, sensor histidine kinase BaeS
MSIISGTILMSVHWSFSEGFSNYLLQAEATQLDKLVDSLEQFYAQAGSWQHLQGNRHAWNDLLRQSLEEQHLPPHLQPHHSGGFSPPPPADRPDSFPPPEYPGDFHVRPPWLNRYNGKPPKMLGKFMGSRLQLLDADKNKLVGMADGLAHSVLRPIQQGKHTVGWLALQPNELVSDELAQLFVKQQIRNNYRIAGLSLCLAVWGSLVLSRKLLKPIKRLAAGAKTLVTGVYSVQIKVDSQDELGQLANDFNLLARTLKRNEEARKYWIADISHELRTPLAILRGEIEAVQDGVRALSQENIQSLHAEVLNLTQLVDDIHELSLSDLGTDHYQLQPVDVDACLQDVVQSFLARFQERHLSLRYRPATGDAMVIEADARRLRQLLVNILENSRRYTDPGGFCEIQLYRTGERVVITIEDTSPGVPDWSLAKLFDRLYRVDKSRNRESGGSGLGLAICKAIVNAHQGDIHAFQSRYGGLGINITLPLKMKPVNSTL